MEIYRVVCDKLDREGRLISQLFQKLIAHFALWFKNPMLLQHFSDSQDGVYRTPFQM